MSKEIWKTVPGTRGDYEVSNFGRARSRKRGKVRIVKISSTNRALQMRCYDSRRRTCRLFTASRLIAELFIRKPKASEFIGYKDRNPLNCAVSNIEIIDAVEHGRRIGENIRVVWCKVDNDGVEQIRRLRAERVPLLAIAKVYNVDISSVSRIARGLRAKRRDARYKVAA